MTFFSHYYDSEMLLIEGYNYYAKFITYVCTKIKKIKQNLRIKIFNTRNLVGLDLKTSGQGYNVLTMKSSTQSTRTSR